MLWVTEELLDELCRVSCALEVARDAVPEEVRANVLSVAVGMGDACLAACSCREDLYHAALDGKNEIVRLVPLGELT